MLLKNELTVRKKALVNPKFPDEEIISEFLTKPSEKPTLNLSWSMPVLHEFIVNISYLYIRFLKILNKSSYFYRILCQVF